MKAGLKLEESCKYEHMRVVRAWVFLEGQVVIQGCSQDFSKGGEGGSHCVKMGFLTMVKISS